MDKFEIKFISNGKEITQEEILNIELKRYKIVFNELLDYGVIPTYKGTSFSREELNNISLKKAKEILAETKATLGIQKIHDLYKGKLTLSDSMWREIAKNSPYRKNYQSCIVEVEAKGISLQEFIAFNHHLEETNNLVLPSKIHPEHYTFEAFPGGQLVMETFGMYKNPTYMKLELSKDSFTPIEIDNDTVLTMIGTTKLMSDDTDTKIIGMHQFKSSENGLKVKLGVFLPQAAPQEIIEGHKYHLAIEFNNVLHYTAELFNKL